MKLLIKIKLIENQFYKRVDHYLESSILSSRHSTIESKNSIVFIQSPSLMLFGERMGQKMDRISGETLLFEAMYTTGQILSHVSVIDGLNARLLKFSAEFGQRFVAIEFCPVVETSSPGKYRSNWVSTGRPSLLMLSEMSGNGSVGCLGLNSLAVGTYQYRSHETQRAITLSDDI